MCWRGGGLEREGKQQQLSILTLSTRAQSHPTHDEQCCHWDSNARERGRRSAEDKEVLGLFCIFGCCLFLLMEYSTQELTLLLLRVLRNCLGVTEDLGDNTTTDSTATFTHGVTETWFQWNFVKEFNLESSVIAWHNELLFLR